MKTLMLLASAMALVSGSASAADVLKARWLASAVGQLSQPDAQGERSAAGEPLGFKGRDLSGVLAQRKMTIKQVWTERAARKTPKAPRKS